ncbi:MAG: iron ABC transporter permease [Betaproteobacteria bacterium]
MEVPAPIAVARPARRPLGALGVAAIVAAALIVVPLAAVVVSAAAPGAAATWQHLGATVLPGYIADTLLLVTLVAAGVTSTGVLTAWLTTHYRFPLARVLDWALILPLAMPAYVMAYAYTDWLQFSGPVQTALRALTGWKAGDYGFPEIRSLGGAAAMFSFALYPYVYVLARAAFLAQSRSALEAARLAGHGAAGSFARVALPLARPAIAAGIALALMEVLADFGTVSYFAVQTFTTGIYRAWLSMGEPVSAAKLALMLLSFVAIVVVVERATRGRARYYATSPQRTPPERLRGVRAALAAGACLAPVVAGFLLPAGILLDLALTDPDARWGPRMNTLIGNSFALAGTTALAAVAVATLLAYAARLTRRAGVARANRVASLGYAIPGAVIAVGILLPLGRLDNLFADWVHDRYGVRIGLLVTGSIAALIYAYLVRFLAVALQAVDAGLAKVTPSMEDAARSLGATPARTLARVHAPMLAGSLLTAALLVFVDVMKELPATFALRPFNYDTLAIEAYNLTKDERLAEAAVPALVIVAVGLVPLFVVSRQLARMRNG